MHDKEITTVNVLTEQLIVTAGLDHLVKIWHVKSGSLQGECEVKRRIKVTTDVKAMKYCPKNGVLAVSCAEGSVNVHHVKISQLLTEGDDISIDENDINIDELEKENEESKEQIVEVKSVIEQESVEEK